MSLDHPGRLASLRHLGWRFGDILRREGIAGFYGRLRHPRPFWRRQPVSAPLAGPVFVQGGNPVWHSALARALGRAGLDLAGGAGDPRNVVIRINCARIPPLLSRGQPDAPREILVLLSVADDATAVSGMLDAAEIILSDSPDLIAALLKQGWSVQRLFSLKGPDALEEGMTRCLAALGNLPPDGLDWRGFSDLQPPPPRHICLSLPETSERRHGFLTTQPGGFGIFDGIRAQPGWVGAGSSFAVIARACLDQQRHPVLVCEDDADFPPDFAARLEIIDTYLRDREWDLFSGLVTDIGPEYEISAVTQYRGETFVHLNRCVGMVCNIYSRTALTRLAAWKSHSGMTIDRHLEAMPGLKVVTTLPFLVGHRDDLTSSVWQFGNRRYRSMIRASAARLERMVTAHQTAARDGPSAPGMP